jgi:hypothetical protein
VRGVSRDSARSTATTTFTNPLGIVQCGGRFGQRVHHTRQCRAAAAEAIRHPGQSAGIHRHPLGQGVNGPDYSRQALRRNADPIRRPSRQRNSVTRRCNDVIHGRFFGVDPFADHNITELAACVRDASALWALFADGLTGMDARLYRNETATVMAMREAIAMLETANEEDVLTNLLDPYLSAAGSGPSVRRTLKRAALSVRSSRRRSLEARDWRGHDTSSTS